MYLRRSIDMFDGTGWCIVRLLILLAAFGATPALAQTKHAFVVGIDTYDKLPPQAQLKKAVGDSVEMAKALSGLGFAVTRVKEPTRGEFFAKWYQFLESVQPGDTVAFVFSGHGVELEGANYLLPRDVPRVRSGREGQLRSESMSFGQLLTDMRERQPAFSFIVLDACRDNPFDEGGRAVGGRRGLGRIEAIEGTFVMYSAGAGQTALDRLDETDKASTSIFTRTLLPLMLKPGLSLLDMADQVGEQVQSLARTAGHSQTPAFYSRVIGGSRVCLAGGCEERRLSSTPDERSWKIIKDTNDIRVLRDFAAWAKGTPYELLALDRAKELERSKPTDERVIEASAEHPFDGFWTMEMAYGQGCQMTGKSTMRVSVKNSAIYLSAQLLKPAGSVQKNGTYNFTRQNINFPSLVVRIRGRLAEGARGSFESGTCHGSVAVINRVSRLTQ